MFGVTPVPTSAFLIWPYPQLNPKTRKISLGYTKKSAFKKRQSKMLISVYLVDLPKCDKGAITAHYSAGSRPAP